MICPHDHKCRTPKKLLALCRQVTCPPAVEHDGELDVVWAQNSCDIYQSQHRKGNDKRMFLLEHHFSCCKQCTSTPHFDFDKAVCLFLNKTADVDAPRSFRFYFCAHMNRTDQRNMREVGCHSSEKKPPREMYYSHNVNCFFLCNCYSSVSVYPFYHLNVSEIQEISPTAETYFETWCEDDILSPLWRMNISFLISSHVSRYQWIFRSGFHWSLYNNWFLFFSLCTFWYENIWENFNPWYTSQ